MFSPRSDGIIPELAFILKTDRIEVKAVGGL